MDRIFNAIESTNFTKGRDCEGRSAIVFVSILSILRNPVNPVHCIGRFKPSRVRFKPSIVRFKTHLVRFKAFRES